MTKEKEKKKFVAPLAEMVDFSGDEIITTSGGAWDKDDNKELWPTI